MPPELADEPARGVARVGRHPGRERPRSSPRRARATRLASFAPTRGIPLEPLRRLRHGPGRDRLRQFLELVDVRDDRADPQVERDHQGQEQRERQQRRRERAAAEQPRLRAQQERPGRDRERGGPDRREQEAAHDPEAGGDERGKRHELQRGARQIPLSARTRVTHLRSIPRYHGCAMSRPANTTRVARRVLARAPRARLAAAGRRRPAQRRVARGRRADPRLVVVAPEVEPRLLGAGGARGFARGAAGEAGAGQGDAAAPRAVARARRGRRRARALADRGALARGAIAPRAHATGRDAAPGSARALDRSGEARRRGARARGAPPRLRARDPHRDGQAHQGARDLEPLRETARCRRGAARSRRREARARARGGRGEAARPGSSPGFRTRSLRVEENPMRRTALPARTRARVRRARRGTGARACRAPSCCARRSRRTTSWRRQAASTTTC